MHRRAFLALAASVPLVGVNAAQPAASAHQQPPPLMLAGVAPAHADGLGYWVSEKYDGVRAYWNGRQMVTRSGAAIPAPAWFTHGWPEQPLDGELWAGRGQFAQAVSAVRQLIPDDDTWRKLRFMVFDVPAHGGVFRERIEAYQGLVADMHQPWVQATPQWRVNTRPELLAVLNERVADGAEGLMMHRDTGLYRAHRSNDLLKLKLHSDAEARVVAHVAGRGQLKGLMGALELETPQGQRFNLGTGFSRADREQPPPVGSLVTYRYQGLTRSGLPRFAHFLRVHPEGL